MAAPAARCHLAIPSPASSSTNTLSRDGLRRAGGPPSPHAGLGARRYRQHAAALPARPQRFARVEPPDDGGEIALDVGAREALLVERAAAALAEPRQRVQLVGPPLALDDES